MSGEARRFTTPIRILIPLMLWFVIFLFARGLLPGLRAAAIKYDFAIYYVSALELRHGINPYTTDFTVDARRAGLKITDVTRSTEPPFALLLVKPLTRYTPLTAFNIWSIMNLIALIAALILLLRRESAFSRAALWTLAALAFAYPPVLSHFWYGQSKLPILLLLVVFTGLLERGSDELAGVALALAGLMRVYPLVLGGYLVLERRWRALAWMLGSLFVGWIATVVLIGPVNCVSFAPGLSYLMENTWIAKSGDNAPLAALVRSFSALGLGSLLSFETKRSILLTVDFLLLTLTVRATLAHQLGDRKSDFRIVSLWVVTAIILPPVSWDHDMTLALMPLIGIALAASKHEASHRTIAMAIISWLLVAIWRFSGIRDGEIVSGFASHALHETSSLSLMCMYWASYWFVLDTATESIPLWQVPLVALTRIFGTSGPKLNPSSIEVTG